MALSCPETLITQFINQNFYPMVMTDLMGRGSSMFRLILCCSLLLCLENQLSSQSMICDDKIFVSLDHPDRITGDCDEVEIFPDALLEGSTFGNCDVTISVEAPTGAVNSSDPAMFCYAKLTEGVGLYSVTISHPSGNSCWGYIEVEDKLGPYVDPAECDIVVAEPFLCLDVDGIIPHPPYVDCSDVTVTATDNVSDLDCEDSELIKTWILTDEYGNSSSCVITYTFAPLDADSDNDGEIDADWPVVCPEQHIDLPCHSPTEPEDIYDFFFNRKLNENLELCGDVCNPKSSLYEDSVYDAYVADAKWHAVQYAYPYIVTGVDAKTGVPTYIILEGNICNTFTSYEDLILPVCGEIAGCEEENNKVIRTWTVYNWCDPAGLVFTCTQVIRAVDNEGPDLEVKSFATSVDPWGCTTDVFFPKPGHLYDDCSSFVDYYVSTGSGTGILSYHPTLGWFAEDVPVGHHTFWYNAYDCCGNFTYEPITVSVTDATPPVAITKQDIVLSLIPNPGSPGEPGLTKIKASNIDNGSFDGCGDVHLEIRREADACGIHSNLTYNNDGHMNDDSLDVDDGAFVQFCCNDLIEYGVDDNGDGINDYALIKVWLRVWDNGDGVDGYGSDGDNYSEVWSWVRLEDKSRPTIVCPADVTIDCSGDPYDWPNMGRALGYNSCGDMGTAYTDETALTNCEEGVITRTWYVIGNESINCVQHISKDGDREEIEVHFPNDTIITCTDEYDEIPYWDNAGACDQMAYHVDRDTFLFTEGACYKILNRWTVINWCDYNPNYIPGPYDLGQPGIWNNVQVVKILDEAAPVIEHCDNIQVPTGSDCIGGVSLTNSASDVGICASMNLLWEVQVDLYGDWVIDYVYSSTINPASEFYIPPSISGEDITITLPEGVKSSEDHRVVWKVTDGCGNDTACTTFFDIVDNIPPTPYCVNLSTALMETGTVELWACDFDLGAFDNCTDHDDLRFTFTETHPDLDSLYNPLARCSAQEFTCDDIINPGGTLVTLDVYVWDLNDNFDFCTVFLTLVDNNDSCEDVTGSRSMIAGDVKTEYGEPVENVEVHLNSSRPGYPLMNMTNDRGEFEFDSNNELFDYSLDGDKNDDYLNGVSTLDLLMIQRHILGIDILESTYKMIAADINNDSQINGIDLVELRKLILGIYTELPQNDSWRFVDKSSSMDPVYPWPLSEIRLVLALQSDMLHEDFIGIKVGDVNESAIVNASQNVVSNRSNTAIDLQFEDVSYVNGDIVEMNLKTDDMNQVYGMQFTMDLEGLELLDVVSNTIEINSSNVAVMSDENITLSWNSIEAIKDNELMTFKFKAKESGSLSNNISLSSSITRSEAYSGSELAIIPITLNGHNNSGQEFTLNQNNPNPFNGSTLITFNLPESTEATITVSDVAGRTVWTYSNQFERGLNSLELDSRDLNTTGVLYYKIETGDYSATKKMIVLK